MEREYYKSTSKIWLIGDSNPKCENELNYPLDEIHPARHNIWTPIYDVIQERLFEQGARLDKKKLFIRNAVENAEDRCFAKTWDKSRLVDELIIMSKLIKDQKPILILTFGSFAYEFVRRARFKDTESPNLKLNEIKRIFDNNVKSFDSESINVLPLLHAIVARKFNECHEAYKDEQPDNKLNYFDYTGHKIADILIEHKEKFEDNMLIK